MYKIKNIKLNNFKFFFGEQNLKLDKKHTLIYGENGSGKSSIYWALHCFLHSTYNPQIQISAESETKRSIFREKDKTKRSKKESAQHSKSRNKSFVMTSVSAL